MSREALAWELGAAQGLSTDFLADGEGGADSSASPPEATLPGDVEHNAPANNTTVNPAPGPPPLIGIVADNAEHLDARIELFGLRRPTHFLDLYARAMERRRDDDLDSLSTHSSMPSLESVSVSSESYS